MSRNGILILLIGAAVMIAGCGQKSKTEPVSRICVERGMQEVMETTEDVLGGMHFRIEKSDLAEGYMRTQPLRGAQFFEFWRKDNVGGYNAAESNLSSVRRTAELTFTEQGSAVCVDCEVRTERLGLDQKSDPLSGREATIFSPSGVKLEKLTMDSEMARWEEMGRDELLASRILERLEKKMRLPRRGARNDNVEENR